MLLEQQRYTVPELSRVRGHRRGRYTQALILMKLPLRFRLNRLTRNVPLA